MLTRPTYRRDRRHSSYRDADTLRRFARYVALCARLGTLTLR